MATFSQVVKEQSFEVFETNNVFPAQKTQSKPLSNETTSSVLTSVTNESSSLSSSKKESSSTSVVESVKSDNKAKIKTFRELCDVLELQNISPTKSSAPETPPLPVPSSKPVLLPEPAKELSSTSLVKSVRARICTIEELLDSSSDLDLPTTTPPPTPKSAPTEIEPKPTAIATPVPTPIQAPVPVPVPALVPVAQPSSVSKPIPVLATKSLPVTQQTAALPAIAESSRKRPAAPKRSPSRRMSEDKNIFLHSNGATSDFSASKDSSNSKTSLETNSKATNLTDINDDRSDSISPTPTTATTIATAGGISINHYERLIEELKCPGCASPMKAPIRLCATGHSICQNCTTVLTLCPLCKETFIELRSLTLEALCSKAHFRCTNAAAGCTVRLQIDLLNWHEKQCVWKSMKCFMGRVWGDCTWTGREAGWKDHLESTHANRVFLTNEVDLVWNMNGRLQSLSGYYVFEVYDEMFNFYQIYDRDRVLFTMTVTSTIRDRKLNFAYEVEMYHKQNEALVITQRFPVHSEYDKDILLDGTCVCVALTDLARLIGQEKILNFRVRIHEIKSPKKSKPPRKPSRKHPIDFQQTDIEGANLKSVPSGVILTRKLEDTPLDHSKANDEEKDFMKDEETSSSDDPEFEAFIEKKWGTPQMNFNRKYLRSSTSKDSSSSSASSTLSTMTDGTGAVDGLHRQTCEIGGTKSKMRNVTSSLRKSFRSLKTDIIDLKKPFTKKSPEKKESLIKK